MRRQLRFLGEVIRGLDFVHMHPAQLVSGELPAGVTVRVLAKADGECLAYVRAAVEAPKKKPNEKTKFAANELVLSIELPSGSFKAEWLDTRAGTVLEPNRFRHSGGVRQFAAPAFQDDVALRLKR